MRPGYERITAWPGDPFGMYDAAHLSGLVQTWPSSGPTSQDIQQTNPALAPTTGTLGAQPVVVFASGDFLQAAIAHDWRFLSNGTGCTYIGVVKPQNNGNNGTIFDTGPFAATDTGAGLWYDGTNQQFDLFVSNGAALIINRQTGAGSYPRNVAHVVCYQYDEATVPKYALYIDDPITPVLSGAPTGAPSAGDPVGPLFVGNHTNAHAVPFVGPMGPQFYEARTLLTIERQRVMLQMRQMFGI